MMGPAFKALCCASLLSSMLVFAAAMDSGDEEEWRHWLQIPPQSPEEMHNWPGQSNLQRLHSEMDHGVGSSYLTPQYASETQVSNSNPTFDHAPPQRELDQADFAFLNSISNDLSAHESDNNPSSPLQQPVEAHRQPRSSPRRQDIDLGAARSAVKRKGASFQAHNAKLIGFRKKLDWPPPRSLAQLEFVPKLIKQDIRGQVSFNEDGEILARINSQVFGNKVHFVPPTQITISRYNTWYDKSPFSHGSYRLPRIDALEPQRDTLDVYMTEHSSQRVGKYSHLGNGPLDDKPFFMFWKKEFKGTQNKFVYLGSGYIRKEDNDAVDEHLEGVLEAAKRAHGARR